MKKLLLAGVAIAALYAGPIKAGQITQIVPFFGGFDVWTNDPYNGYCRMANTDAGYQGVLAGMLAAAANPGWNVQILTTGQIGWGNGLYGSSTCAYPYIWPPQH